MGNAGSAACLAYDVWWILSRYFNNYITYSTAAREGDPGARLPVSLQHLLKEMDPGHYMRQPLLIALKLLLDTRNTRRTPIVLAPQLAPYLLPLIGGGGVGKGIVCASAGTGGGIVKLDPCFRNKHDSEVIPNPRPVQHLCLLQGENTRGSDGRFPSLR